MALIPGRHETNTLHAVQYLSARAEFMVMLTEGSWMIYIVDDDDSVRKSLSRLMRTCGFDVKVFATGDTFLAECTAAAAHTCVLMDITMPRMSGLQVQSELKERGIDLPIIAISARDDEDTRTMARKLGARFFLRKPVDDRALLDAIAWVTGARV